MTTISDLENDEGSNIQIAFDQLKKDIIGLERKFTKENVGIARTKIQTLQEKKKALLTRLETDRSQITTEAANIQKEIDTIA